MAIPPNRTKAKTAEPKAPSVIYVPICKQGDPQCVFADPESAEDLRDVDDRIARYIFNSFVEVEIKAVVTDVAA